MNKNWFNRTTSFLMLITIAAAFVHADSPMSIAIYNSDLVPGPGVAKLPDSSQSIVVFPGTRYLLAANVFDRNGVLLSQYRISPLQNNIVWSVSDRFGDIAKNFDTLKGAVCHFTPTRGYDSVTVVATFRPDSLTAYTDTVGFLVPGCCSPKYLVIEPKGALDLFRQNRLDTLFVLSDEQSSSVYTTLRDTFGNFVSYGKIARWVSLDTSIVKVEKGDTLFGEGIVTRTKTTLDSIGKIYAVDVSGAVSDTCVVKLACGCYESKLRIVIGNDTNPTSLVMNTNQDTTLTVQGQRSSDGVWVDVSAVWQSSPNLKIEPAAPVAPGSHSWQFSPFDTGTGWICVARNDGHAWPDTLPVHFTGGPSVRRSTFELITPPNSIVAGKPILAITRIYDKNGNGYSGTIRVAYRDALGSGGVSFPEPFIIVDGDTILLDSSRWSGGNQTFVNGVDTVSFVLFYAPLDTTKVHQLYAEFIIGTDTINASSTPIVLPINNVVYAKEKFLYANGMDVPDTVLLTNAMRFYLAGYDIYGNQIGEINGTWSVTGSLHPFSGPTTGSSIYFDPSVAINSESGYIIVDHDGIKDSVFLIINLQNIRDNAGLLLDKWKIAVAGNVARLHIPLRGTHLIKAYSLSGSIIYSSRTSANNVQIKLPKGVFVLSVQTIGSVERFTTKVVNQ